MARKPRLILPGHAHLLMQRGHNGQAIVHDTRDAQAWLDILRDVAATHRVAVHGWSLTDTAFRLLATPAQESALSRMLQDLGRRYVGLFNARHGRTGTLWDGRFRCAVLEPGDTVLLALAWIERNETAELGHSSRGHHLGATTGSWLSDPPAYWALGNTPFERHVAWGQRLEQEVSRSQLSAIERALRGGLPLAGIDWLQRMQPQMAVDLFPRPRGRPRMSPARSH